MPGCTDESSAQASQDLTLPEQIQQSLGNGYLRVCVDFRQSGGGGHMTTGLSRFMLDDVMVPALTPQTSHLSLSY